MISKIVNNPKVSRYGLYKEGEKIVINDKISYSITTATDKALELTPYKAKKGRLPQNINETAIEAWVLPYINKDAEIGDKINVNNKQYTLVGILENNLITQSSNEGIVLTKDNKLDTSSSSLLVEISPKANLKKTLKEMEIMTNKDNIMKNSYVIAMEGGSDDDSMKGIYEITAIIISIVLIATIAVIYNSFQISVVERIKQFGLLRAVGTTPKQIRKIVLREASVLIIIGVPIGLIFGIFAMEIIGFLFNKLVGSMMILGAIKISPMVLVLSSIVAIIAIYISALIPSISAGRISPLTAINSRSSIKKEKIKVRKNFIIQKIFGFEGAMASKNIKRNRKRYRITVFSIVISVVLFVTFKYFTDLALNVNGNINTSRNIQFCVYNDDSHNNSSQVIENDIIDKVKSLSSIKKVYKVYEPFTFKAVIDKKDKIKEVDEIRTPNDKDEKKYDTIYKDINYNGKDRTQINAGINVYDNNALESAKKYLTAGSIDVDNLNKENGVIVIERNEIYNANKKKSYIGPAADIKVGDEILLQSDTQNSSNFGGGDVKKVKVLGIVKDDPFDFNGSQNGIKMITTEELSKRLTNKSSLNVLKLNITVNNDKDDKKISEDIQNVIKSNSSLQVINYIDQNKQVKSGMLMIQILLYGFVVVISLISSVNIVNTLTTNIIIRRREFAALKSIGLTQKGLRKMIVLEGLLYGIMGSLYGAVISSGLSYLIFKSLNSVKEQRWVLPWNAILIAAICSLALGYLSVISPLMRIKKDNLIESIREE